MIPASAVSRLAKLLPMLSSDNDGEAMAALRMVRKALADHGADLHDLTETVVHGKIVMAPRSPEPPHNYADTYGGADRSGPHDFHPSARTRKFGLPIWHHGEIIPWWDVARECLRLNKSIPKKLGGRFLLPVHVTLLTAIEQQQKWPTNDQASWIETVIARCHQARDHSKRERPSHAHS